MKKTFVVLLALVVFLALFACTKASAQQSAEGITVSGQSYKLGDTGPAGGIVFYDRGFTEGGWRYLEAAPAGTEFTAVWGPITRVAGTETKVGSGKRNTQLIVEVLGENGKAAQLCASLNVNGHNDWFLPSRDELDLIHNTLKQKGLGNFLSRFYWSSSQNDSNSGAAWAQSFSDGYQREDDFNKKNTYFVRAVRAF